MALNCDERCRCQPKGVSPRIPQPGLRKCCWLRLWIVLRLWMSGVFQLVGTLRNKLLCTFRHLRQQLRDSLRASEIRLRRTVRTNFLLRVPAALVLVICATPACDADGQVPAPCLICAMGYQSKPREQFRGFLCPSSASNRLRPNFIGQEGPLPASVLTIGTMLLKKDFEAQPWPGPWAATELRTRRFDCD